MGDRGRSRQSDSGWRGRSSSQESRSWGGPSRESSMSRSASAESRGGASRSMDSATAVSDVKRSFQHCLVNAPARVQLPNGRASRPNQGTVGQKVMIKANHFKVGVKKDMVALQYDVDIDRVWRGPNQEGRTEGRSTSAAALATQEGPPPMPDRNRCYAVINRLAQLQRWPVNRFAYDGQKLLYTVGEPFLSPDFEEEFRVEVSANAAASSVSSASAGVTPGRDIAYDVRIKHTAVREIGAVLAEFYRPYFAAVNYRQQNPMAQIPPPIPAIEATDVLPALQALDISLRMKTATDPQSRVVGSGVYWPEDKKPLRPTLEAWAGYRQALVPTQGGLHFVMDCSRTVMPIQISLIEWMAATLNTQAGTMIRRPLSHQEIEDLNRAVASKDVKVEVRHRSHGRLRHTVRSFTTMSASNATFALRDGTVTNVQNYFLQAHGITLKYPGMPCAVTSRTSRRDPNRTPEWMPVEVCMVIPETSRRKLDTAETTEMLRAAAEKPDERQLKILKQLVQKADFWNDFVVREFGMQFQMRREQPEMLDVNGRILPTPRLQYGGDLHMDPGSKGEWNLRDATFFKPVEINSFAIVCFVPRSNLLTLGHYEDEPQLLINFKLDLRDALLEKGIVIRPRLEDIPTFYCVDFNRKTQLFEDAMVKTQEKLGVRPQLLIVIQATKGQVYNEAKFICDTVLGVMSQMVVAENVGLGRNTNPSAIGRKLAGLALKINTKLGGENCQITGGAHIWCPALGYGGGGGGAPGGGGSGSGAGPSIVSPRPGPAPRPAAAWAPGGTGTLALRPAVAPTVAPGRPVLPTAAPAPTPGLPPGFKRVMMMGADVTHQAYEPGSGAREGRFKKVPDAPSIAAVVGSINLSCTRYASRTMAQDEEIIGSLADMAKELIELFEKVKANGGYPDAIIMFRDGVSEGEIAKVMDREVRAIREACERIRPGYKPALTFVTVQKRHGTRLFPHPQDRNSYNEASGRGGGNVRPGLVVDADICHPYEFDYYLNAHAAIQGTNKPAKYHVLVDDNNFSADSLQLLTYWLSHTYVRCTRTVSYCPPAYYAHLAAFRARSRLILEERTMPSQAASSTTASDLGMEGRWAMADVHPGLRNTMFFI